MIGRVVIAVATMAAALALAPAAGAQTTWLCGPGAAPDPCRESLQTTVQQADGTSTVETPALARDPAVDCFYVYPTVSEQQAVNADLAKDPQELAIAHYQAARFSQRCRVFAPMYRQLTLQSITAGDPVARARGAAIAYAGVRAAWREYLRRFNRGRGVVLIGHSQGTFLLRTLVRREIDPSAAHRRRLVSALLLGGNVLIRKGRDTGGDFQAVRACRRSGQVGCVIAYSIFDEPAPPADARFGRSPAADFTGGPTGDAYEVLCTNPASLHDNARTAATTLVRSEPFPGTLGLGLQILYGGPTPTAPTPWLEPSERYSVQCRDEGGADVLDADPIGTARRLNASPDATWGLHLADVNLPLGDLVDEVGRQAAAFRARRPALRLARTCAGGRARLTLTGPDRLQVRRLELRAGGRRVAVDRSAPFALRLPAGVTRVRARVALGGGRSARLSRAVRACA